MQNARLLRNAAQCSLALRALLVTLVITLFDPTSSAHPICSCVHRGHRERSAGADFVPRGQGRGALVSLRGFTCREQVLFQAALGLRSCEPLAGSGHRRGEGHAGSVPPTALLSARGR